MHEFDDIRPYHDEEVKWVVQGLLEDLALASALGKFRYPKIYRWLPGPVTRLVQSALRQELRNVDSVHDVQIIIEKYLDKLIETTTNGLTYSGLDALDPAKSYLFISNHRDIAMDPTLVNYMLYHHGFDTLQIAIGDNLLKRPFLTKLMKLNKSFLVKRGLQGRDKLAASKQLSNYISYCITTGQNVWIAQREGRAKNGIDETESAVIKMLHMASRDSSEKLSLGAAINKLNIVPVAISYEYDPCDVNKAKELHAVATEGCFVKDENSDIHSILIGIIGIKGAVHVSFGKPLQVPLNATSEQVACLIDQHVVDNYRLHPSNYLALQQLQPNALDFAKVPQWCGLSAEALAEKHKQFEQRMAEVSPELLPILLQAYANPVLRRHGMLS